MSGERCPIIEGGHVGRATHSTYPVGERRHARSPRDLKLHSDLHALSLRSLQRWHGATRTQAGALAPDRLYRTADSTGPPGGLAQLAALQYGSDVGERPQRAQKAQPGAVRQHHVSDCHAQKRLASRTVGARPSTLR